MRFVNGLILQLIRGYVLLAYRVDSLFQYRPAAVAQPIGKYAQKSSVCSHAAIVDMEQAELL